MVRDYFPLGIAIGTAHCNRRNERDHLANNIRQGRHTWLSARRRMGKTSLVEQVSKDLARKRQSVVTVSVDLLVIHDAEALVTRLRQAVAEATQQLLPKNQRALERLKKAFGALTPELTLGDDGFTVKLGPGTSTDQTIEMALHGLDRIAGDKKRRVMFICDEFQQLSSIKDHAVLEAAIRHAAERTKHVAFVFAGSERHLLADMFENPGRPLYQLCDRMTLGRIAETDYKDFLITASKARWKKTISVEAIAHILALTLRHPYYVNALCGRLWDEPRPPSVDTVKDAWLTYVEDDKRRVAARVLELSPAQRALLAQIAREPTPHPAGQEFLQKVRLPASTGVQAKHVLERGDLIQQDEQGVWELVDPVLATVLKAL